MSRLAATRFECTAFARLIQSNAQQQTASGYREAYKAALYSRAHEPEQPVPRLTKEPDVRQRARPASAAIRRHATTLNISRVSQQLPAPGVHRVQ